MRRALAAAWTLVVAAVVAHNAALWTGALRLETNLLALLPSEDGAAPGSLDDVGEDAARTLVVLVGSPDEHRAAAAARQVEAALAHEALQRLPEPAFDARALFPHRDVLLAESDARWLAEAGPDDVAERALALLQQPFSPQLGRFEEDPLQLFDGWLFAMADATPVRPLGDQHVVRSEGVTWVLLKFASTGSAFALDGRPRLRDALERARALVPDVQVLWSGIPLFAEAAAVQANHEVSTVGLGSLLAVVLLVVLAFRSSRPLLLVVTSVVVGVLVGLSVTALVFERVHLLTLVFGASLVGVAEDYGIHYFASRQARPGLSAIEQLERLLPGLRLALLTSIAGYAMLALVPFPGLRQVAVFSVLGLAGAFMTVVCWFPALDRGAVPSTALSRRWAASRAAWPHLQGRGGVLLLSALVLATVVGLARARVDDDVRALVARDGALLERHQRVEALLGLPSPAQRFVVVGASADEVLEREEALVARLEVFRRSGALQGVIATSTWVPTEARQRRHHALSTSARRLALAALEEDLDRVEPPGEVPFRPLSVQAFLSTGLGKTVAPLWREGRSMVLLRSPSPEALEAFHQLQLPGVTFVDQTKALSELLGRWRVRMSELLLVGLLVVVGVLASRMGRRAFRAVFPTALSMGLTVAVVSQFGPLTLFHCLGLWILLGTGVDYGIFLLEHPMGDHDEAWFSVGVGAASTLLSFGLLGLSSTPAISGFGLTVGIGTLLVWGLSPMLIDRSSSPTRAG